MCSLADDNDVTGGEELVNELDHQLQTKIKLDVKSTQCSKCGQVPAAVILRVRNVYCTNCLQLSVNHKFRSCLGKSHLMRAGEKVLIAFSGGPSSVAMLHLTKQGLDETSHKKLLFAPVVVYVDESALVNVELDKEDRERTIDKICSVVKDYGFPFYATSIENAMYGTWTTDLQLSLDPDESRNVNEDKVSSSTSSRDLFQSIKSLTSKEDLLVKLRQKLLCDIARNHGCSKVFLGDSESRIAVRVLSDIAQGKGRHMSLACGFVDDRFEDVLLVRPMREILAKEISFYVRSQRLNTVTGLTFTTKHKDGGSIQQVTEKFVFGLQKEFPSTVSTIFRTGDKMSKKALKTSSNNCILCMAPLDVMAADKRAEDQSSKTVDKPSCRSSCSCSSNKMEKSDLRMLMCYACQIILDETPCVDMLPSFVFQSAAVRVRRSKMKSEIEEYLLDVSPVDGTSS